MDRFGRVLRRAERRLEAPEPERSRILLELAGDLEDLYRAYRERGLEEEEAVRRAERWLAPSSTALASLRDVHLPAFDRLLDRLGGTTRGRVELVLVALASLLAVGGGVIGVLRSGALSASSPGLWTVAGLGVAGLGVGLSQGYALFVRGDRLGPGWRRRLRRVLAAAAATALAGLLAGAVRLSVAAVPFEGGGIPSALWSEVATAAGVAALGLGASLLLTLLWLVLRARAVVVARAREELRERVGRLDGERPEGQGEVSRRRAEIGGKFGPERETG
jgi:hypothetical protein